METSSKALSGPLWPTARSQLSYYFSHVSLRAPTLPALTLETALFPRCGVSSFTSELSLCVCMCVRAWANTGASGSLCGGQRLTLVVFLSQFLSTSCIFKYLPWFYVWVFGLHICLCTTCMSGAHRGEEGPSDIVDLELQNGLWATMWVLGIEPGPLGRVILLISEPLLHLWKQDLTVLARLALEIFLFLLSAGVTVTCGHPGVLLESWGSGLWSSGLPSKHTESSPSPDSSVF